MIPKIGDRRTRTRSFTRWDDPRQLLADLLSRSHGDAASAVAIQLLHSFSTLREVLHAGWLSLLARSDWRAATRIKLIGKRQRAELLARDGRRPLLHDLAALEAFLVDYTEYLEQDGLTAIHVDRDMRLLRLQEAGPLRFGEDLADISGLLREAAALGAAGFYLVEHRRKDGLGVPATILHDLRFPQGGKSPLMAQLRLVNAAIMFIDRREQGHSRHK